MAILNFFSDLEAEVVSEIDESHKLIRYSFKRKTSVDSEERKGADDEDLFSRSFLMLVSYQLMGTHDDTASISLFEFDEVNSCINPHNFIIVTQKINKDSQQLP